MARTDTLPHFLTDVADAIREKKGTSETIQASNFDTEIENLPSGGGEKMAPYSITFQNDTSSTIDLSGLDTSKLKTVSNMFSGCSNITTVDLSGFGVSEITNVGSMFNSCSSLTSVDLSNFDATVGTIVAMFLNCSNITSIDIRKLKISTAYNVNMANVFNGCRNLMHLDIRSMEFTKAFNEVGTFNNVPTDCEIIVKDATAKSYINTTFPTLTNVKTVAEYEAE